MGNACQRVTTAEIDQPFPIDRGRDKGVDPEGPTDSRAFEYEILKGSEGKNECRGGRQGLRLMVGLAQENILEIDKIVGDHDAHDLTTSIFGVLLPRCPAGEEKRADLRRLILDHHRRASRIVPDVMRQSEQGIPIHVIERNASFDSLDEFTESVQIPAHVVVPSGSLTASIGCQSLLISPRTGYAQTNMGSNRAEYRKPRGATSR